MKKVPKLVNKIPLYIFLVICIAIIALFLTGKFKFQVVNVSAEHSESTENFIEYSIQNLKTVGDLIKNDKTIVLISSSWCSNCSYMRDQLKNFATKNVDFKVYELDLDEFRSVLTNNNIDSAPTIVRTISGKLQIQQNISISDFNDLVNRDLLGLV